MAVCFICLVTSTSGGRLSCRTCMSFVDGGRKCILPGLASRGISAMFSTFFVPTEEYSILRAPEARLVEESMGKEGLHAHAGISARCDELSSWRSM